MSSESTDLQGEDVKMAEALTNQVSALVEGRDVRVAFVALFAGLEHVSKQAEPAVRAQCVAYLQQLTSELESMDAQLH